MVLGKNRVSRGAGARKRIQNDGVGIGGDLEDSLDQFERLGSEVRQVVRENLQEGLLGALGVVDLLVRPDCLWNQTVLHLGQETLDGGDLVAVAAPPDAIVLVQVVEALLRDRPISPRWRAIDNAPTRASYGVGPLAVGVARREVAGLPRPPRIVIGVAITRVGLRSAWQQVPRKRLLASRVRDDEVMVLREVLGAALGRVHLLPYHGRDEVLLPENLVHQTAQVMNLVVVDRHEDRAVFSEQLAQELEARQHHAAPLVVAGQVVAVHHPPQPVLHEGRVHVVVVRPALIPCVVGRVDVDALHLAVVGRQKRLQGREVVALNDQVVAQARLVAQPLLALRQQLVERHGQMVILDEDLPLEAQSRHEGLLDAMSVI